MVDTIEELLRLIELEPLGDDRLRAAGTGDPGGHMFGGRVLAQALCAAQHTVDPRRPAHSLHAYFVRAGDPGEPVDYAVERTRDGRGFSTRRLLATQHGRTLFTMIASFHLPEQGPAHQAEPIVDVPPPEALPTQQECVAEYERKTGRVAPPWASGDRAIEQRPADGFFGRPESRPPFHRAWLRAGRPLPEAPSIHQCAFAYASDMSLIDTAKFPHGEAEEVDPTSLDHAIWFHRPFRMDDWLLFVQDSPTAGGARGLARGRVFTREGELVASVAQEGLLRRPSR